MTVEFERIVVYDILLYRERRTAFLLLLCMLFVASSYHRIRIVVKILLVQLVSLRPVQAYLPPQPQPQSRRNRNRNIPTKKIKSNQIRLYEILPNHSSSSSFLIITDPLPSPSLSLSLPEPPSFLPSCYCCACSCFVFAWCLFRCYATLLLLIQQPTLPAPQRPNDTDAGRWW